jgi:hypothetical protein
MTDFTTTIYKDIHGTVLEAGQRVRHADDDGYFYYGRLAVTEFELDGDQHKMLEFYYDEMPRNSEELESIPVSCMLDTIEVLAAAIKTRPDIDTTTSDPYTT